MNWLEALVLGIIQGVTEFLPVSSSGHIQIFKEILGVEFTEDLTFEVIVHAATVCSTIVVLYREIWILLKGFFQFRLNEETIYILKIFVSMIPVAVVGFFFKDYVEDVFGEGLGVVGFCLLVTSCLLAFAYFARPRSKPFISFLDAFLIGIAQAVAVLPGLSRSGSTIATGVLLGNSKEQVAKFSFLMVLIPILGEAFLETLKLVSRGDAVAVATPTISLVVGFLAAFLSGFVACRWMISLVAKGKLIWFAVYCMLVGGIVLIW